MRAFAQTGELFAHGYHALAHFAFMQNTNFARFHLNQFLNREFTGKVLLFLLIDALFSFFFHQVHVANRASARAVGSVRGVHGAIVNGFLGSLGMPGMRTAGHARFPGPKSPARENGYQNKNYDPDTPFIHHSFPPSKSKPVARTKSA